MKEEGLIPFDWDLYCAGAAPFFSNSYYDILDIRMVTRKSGETLYDVKLDDEYSISWKMFKGEALRLLKPKQEEYDHFKDAPEWAVCKTFDIDGWIFHESIPVFEYGYWCSEGKIYKDTECLKFKGDPKDSLIMRGDG